MKVERISHSGIAMLGKCGEQYRRRYIEGDKLPPGFAQIRGKSIHSPIEANMVAKLETGEPLPLEQVRDLAADAVAGALQGEYVLDGDYAELGLERAKGLLTDEVVSLATLHATEVAPGIDPEAVEVKIEIPPSNAIPATFVGVLDLIDARTGIRDTKTAQKSPGSSDADASDQLTAYELLYRARYGQPSKGQALDVLVRTPKRGELLHVHLPTKRTTDDLRAYVARVQAAIQAIEREVFLPAPQDSWVCSERWCGYASTCPYFRGRPRPTS